MITQIRKLITEIIPSKLDSLQFLYGIPRMSYITSCIGGKRLITQTSLRAPYAFLQKQEWGRGNPMKIACLPVGRLHGVYTEQSECVRNDAIIQGLNFSIILIVFGLIFFISSATGNASGNEGDIGSIKNLIENKEYSKAKEDLRDILKNNPSNEVFYEAHLSLGKCFYYEGDSEGALNEFALVNDSISENSSKEEAVFFTAEAYFKKKDFNKAIDYYDLLIEEFPRTKFYSALIYGKGWSYYELNEFNTSLSYFKILVNDFPEDKFAQDALFRMGICNYSIGNFKESEKDFLKFIDKYPLSNKAAEAFYSLGEIKYSLEDYPEAIKYFDRALNIKTDGPWAKSAVYHRGWSLLYLGRFEEASVNFKEICKDADDNPFLLGATFGMARGLKGQSNFKEADRKFEEIISFLKNSDDEESLFWKGTAFIELGRFDEAINLYRKTLAKLPESKGVFNIKFNLASALYKKGEPAAAEKELEEIFENSKNDFLKVKALLKIADSKFDKEALIYYDKILKFFPESPLADYAQYRIGVIFMNIGDFDSAALAFKSLILNFPDSKYSLLAQLSVGEIFLRKNKFQEAASIFSKFIKDYSYDKILEKKANLKLAGALKGQGKFDEAIFILLELKKDDLTGNVSESASYELARTYYEKGKIKDALREFNDFLKKYPSSELSSGATLWLAEYYYEIGDYKLSYEWCNKILDKSVEAHYILGSILYSQNKPEDALKEFKFLKEEKNNYFYEKAIFKLANILSDLKNDLEAFENYELLTKDGESDIAKISFRKMAEISKKESRFDDAVSYYLKSMSGKDMELNAQIQFQIAEVFELKNDFEQALVEYKRVNSLYPANRFWGTKSLLKVAELCEKLNRPEEAAKVYEALSKSDSEVSRFAKAKLAYYKKFLKN